MLDLVVGVPTRDDSAWKNIWTLLDPGVGTIAKVGAGLSLARQAATPILESFSMIASSPRGSRSRLAQLSHGPSVPTSLFPPQFDSSASQPQPSARMRRAEVEAEPTRRRVNIDVRRLRGFERRFRVLANIGLPKPGTAGGPFHEPDWHGLDHLELRLVLDGDADITPAWHDIRLEKTGHTPDVEFIVTAYNDAPLQLDLRVYSAKEFMLLEQYVLEIEVAGAPA